MNKDPKILSKIHADDIKQKLPTMNGSFGLISVMQGWFNTPKLLNAPNHMNGFKDIKITLSFQYM